MLTGPVSIIASSAPLRVFGLEAKARAWFVLDGDFLQLQWRPDG
jgi:hypothetical protein